MKKNKAALLRQLEKEIAEAREQVERGEVLTHEEVMKKLGLEVSIALD